MSTEYEKGLEAYQSENFETALEHWTVEAKQGDAKAQCKLGYMYLVNVRYGHLILGPIPPLDP